MWEEFRGNREALGLLRRVGWRRGLRRHIASECYDLEREMGDLARYFDYEAFGRNLFMYDYAMGANGNVLRVV